jgi:hypothetical protein
MSSPNQLYLTSGFLKILEIKKMQELFHILIINKLNLLSINMWKQKKIEPIFFSLQ